jgi:hypothetical protein
LTDEGKNREQTPAHEEGGVVILPTPAERENAARNAERMEEWRYKHEQSSIQRRILLTQIALVGFGVISGGIGLWQANIAQQSADTSQKSVLLAQKSERDARLMSERQFIESQAQFDKALGQMKEQSRLQGRSADAAIKAAKISAAALASTQREAIIENGAALAIADLGFPKRDGQSSRVKWEWAFENYGKTPAVDVTVRQAIDVGTSAHMCWREGDQPRSNSTVQFPAPIFSGHRETGYCLILTDEWSGARVSEYDRRRTFKGGIKLNLDFRYSDAYGTYTMAICLENAGNAGIADGDVTPHAVFCNAPRRTEERPTTGSK